LWAGIRVMMIGQKHHFWSFTSSWYAHASMRTGITFRWGRWKGMKAGLIISCRASMVAI